mmetsp:Transcript_38909/g.34583  ORF Transcript_38909/g.34583 Transcript_38909/m.34583 type:complete len:89 (+) Transcript_38909:149-415(+)
MIFEETVKGAYVRVNMSGTTNSSTTAHDYVIAEIVGVEKGTSHYQLDDKVTDKKLKLKHGNKTTTLKMCFISNGDFTGGEFTKWFNKM